MNLSDFVLNLKNYNTNLWCFINVDILHHNISIASKFKLKEKLCLSYTTRTNNTCDYCIFNNKLFSATIKQIYKKIK